MNPTRRGGPPDATDTRRAAADVRIDEDGDSASALPPAPGATGRRAQRHDPRAEPDSLPPPRPPPLPPPLPESARATTALLQPSEPRRFAEPALGEQVVPAELRQVASAIVHPPPRRRKTSRRMKAVAEPPHAVDSVDALLAELPQADELPRGRAHPPVLPLPSPLSMAVIPVAPAPHVAAAGVAAAPAKDATVSAIDPSELYQLKEELATSRRVEQELWDALAKEQEARNVALARLAAAHEKALDALRSDIASALAANPQRRAEVVVRPAAAKPKP